MSTKHVLIDSTPVKANANKRKFEKKMVRKDTRAYQARLQDEINGDVKKMHKSHSHPKNSRWKKQRKLKKLPLIREWLLCK